MTLASLTAPELIFPDLRCTDRADLLRTLADRIIDSGRVKDADTLFLRLREREDLDSTGIGAGVAIPHCKMDHLARVVLAIGKLRKGIDFGARDGEPVRLFFCVISPTRDPAAHLRCLQAISKWLTGPGHRDQLLELSDPDAIYELLKTKAD